MRSSRKCEGNDYVVIASPLPPPELDWTIPSVKNIGLRHFEWLSVQIKMQLPTDVLLITVNSDELRCCYSYMKQVQRSWCHKLGYVDFGEFGENEKKVRVALISSEKGSISASIVVKNAAEILHPKVVLFVGCCATLNPTKAKLGDVVIPAKLATYSNVKITADGTRELHGVKPNVSRNMGKVISCADHGWNPPLKDQNRSSEVTVHHEGVVLSGPESIENRERSEELVKSFPDAICLETEGEGLYAAAYDLGIEWAVIKGVSNFADGSLTATEEWRLFASTMAASVVFNMFQYRDVIRKWPHYEADLKEDQSCDRQVINENEKKLQNLENRIELLQNKKTETERCIQKKRFIPDKPPTFIGRDGEVEQIISSLVENGCGIVSIVGGPGFGKSTIAREVSHNLSHNHEIAVIFSSLRDFCTVPEVILRLCHDVGLNPGEDPASSLRLWLRNLWKKVVLVMDNIEQLLESNVRYEFTDLMDTLRKHSGQQLQILTTTRTVFSIPERTTKNIQIDELDGKSSVELLKTYCPKEEVKYEYLTELAGLCGFVPLALCIAGGRIPDLDEPLELIQWLRNKPMKALETSDKSQSVQKAIEFSFKMLSDEDKNALARLSVFNGNFRRRSAEEVIEREGLETHDFLVKLVDRSLIQRSSDKRFVIHSLIRLFLADHDQLQDEKARAQGLMVNHFLKICHSSTEASYCKDGFTSARELLKEDALNVEETFKLCSQDKAINLNPNIIESLESSDIYKSSARYFYNFAWDLLPQTVLRNFHEHCTQLAEDRGQVPIQITFQCLVADQEGRKSAWKSDEYIDRMAAIKEFFDRNRAVLKEDRSLFGYCYYVYARYYSNKAPNTPSPDLVEDDLAPLSENKTRSSFEKVDEALILTERAQLNKKRASNVYRTDKEKYEEYMNCAESFYNQALSLDKGLLGDHEVTSICHKALGDLYFTWRKNDKALTCYSDAIELRKKLQLDSTEPFVYLLKNYGACLSLLGRSDESIEILNEARDIADKLTEKHTHCRANVYYQLARAYRAWKSDCQEAVKNAKAAMEMQDLLDTRSVKTLEIIIKTAEENMA